MKQTLIEIESFGDVLRLTFSNGNPIAFQNLLWVCQGENESNEGKEDILSFTIGKERLSQAIKAFRVSNPFQSRRGKGLWKASPFTFKKVSQLASNAIHGMSSYSIGCQKDDKEELARERQFAHDTSKRTKHYDSLIK